MPANQSQWLLTNSHTSPEEDGTRGIGREHVAPVLLQKLDLHTGAPIWEATLPTATNSVVNHANTATQIRGAAVYDPMFEEWRHPIVVERNGVVRVATGALMGTVGSSPSKSMLFQVVDLGDTHGERAITIDEFPTGYADLGLRVVGMSPDGDWLCYSYRRVFLISTDGEIVASLDRIVGDDVDSFHGFVRIIAFGSDGVTAVTGAFLNNSTGDLLIANAYYTDWSLSAWSPCVYAGTSQLVAQTNRTWLWHPPPWSLSPDGYQGYVVPASYVWEPVRVSGGVADSDPFGILWRPGTLRDAGDNLVVRTYDSHGFAPYYENDGVMLLPKDGSLPTNVEFPSGFQHETGEFGFWWADAESFYQEKLADSELEKRTITGDPVWTIAFDNENKINSFWRSAGVVVLSGSMTLPSLPGLCVGILALNDDDGSVLWYAQKPITVAAMPSISLNPDNPSGIDEAGGERYGSGARSKIGQGMVATVANGAVWVTARLFFPPCLVD